MKKKIIVEYTARFRSTIEVEENATSQDILEAMSDINIPEDKGSEYVGDTFEPVIDSDTCEPIVEEFNYTADLHRQLEITGDRPEFFR